MMTLLSLALAAATPATDADRADAQCLVTFAILATRAEKDEAMLGKLRGLSAFFMGRIAGRSPGIDFRALIATANPSPDAVPDNIARCSVESQAMEQAIAAVRAGLSDPAK